MASDVRTGRYLAQLRENAGLKQSEVAQRLDWSPAVLSRIESGERPVSEDELTAVLRAIGTEQALRFAETTQRKWEQLSEPTPGHPDEQLLWEAELAFEELTNLRNDPDIKNVFVKRLDEYDSALSQAAYSVSKTDYTIAFIGDIGVGKSTAICRATNLEVQDGPKWDPVLEAGGGGVTICEVHLVQGPDYGIVVEPVSEGELRREVAEFAKYLMESLQSRDDIDRNDEGIGTSKEIERAIRNMSGLRTERNRGPDGGRQRLDHAKRLAQTFIDENQSPEALAIEILSKMNMYQRNRRELWYSELSGKPPLNWLRDSFVEINNGRNAEFSLPKRIEVLVPKPILAEEALSIRLVDTKGIDGTAEREDLEFHLNEAGTIVLLCSRFNDAPSSSAQRLLERAAEGQFSDIDTKASVLVLPRPEEALAVKNDQGDTAEDAEDGYEMKGEQAETALERKHLPNAGIEFFNVREDDVLRLNAFLLQSVYRLRDLHRQRLSGLVAEVNSLVRNFEKQQASDTLREAQRRLQVWADTHRLVSVAPSKLEDSLLQTINRAYASSVQASVRREGNWYNLDYSHQLGHGAQVKSSKSTEDLQRSFKNVAQNILDDPQMEEAYGLVQQAQRLFDTGITTLLRSSYQLGVSIHVNDMCSYPPFDWDKCEDRWGQGPGYRDDVRGIHQEWFEAKDAIEARFKSHVEWEWERVLRQLSDILETE